MDNHECCLMVQLDLETANKELVGLREQNAILTAQFERLVKLERGLCRLIRDGDWYPPKEWTHE